MKISIKIVFFISLLLTNLVSFAQASDDDTGGGNLDGGDPAVPINDKIMYLLAAGVVLAYFSIKNFKRKQNI